MLHLMLIIFKLNSLKSWNRETCKISKIAITKSTLLKKWKRHQATLLENTRISLIPSRQWQRCTAPSWLPTATILSPNLVLTQMKQAKRHSKKMNSFMVAKMKWPRVKIGSRTRSLMAGDATLSLTRVAILVRRWVWMVFQRQVRVECWSGWLRTVKSTRTRSFTRQQTIPKWSIRTSLS